MSRTFSAVLRGNQLEWVGSAPSSTEPMEVTVILAPQAAEAEKPPTVPVMTPEARKQAGEILRRIAERGKFAPEITDVVAWQREVRRDRPMPGREP